MAFWSMWFTWPGKLHKIIYFNTVFRSEHIMFLFCLQSLILNFLRLLFFFFVYLIDSSRIFHYYRISVSFFFSIFFMLFVWGVFCLCQSITLKFHWNPWKANSFSNLPKIFHKRKGLQRYKIVIDISVTLDYHF